MSTPTLYVRCKSNLKQSLSGYFKVREHCSHLFYSSREKDSDSYDVMKLCVGVITLSFNMRDANLVP